MNVHEDRISADLRWLTEVLANKGAEISGGFLGGRYGYGAEYENDTFMMHPYCWCEHPDCPWCLPCECGDDSERYFIGDREVHWEEFWASGGYLAQNRSEAVPEKQCINCREGRERAPNFLHKPSGTSVRWYKYIGRSMEVDLEQPWDEVWADVRNSLEAS